MEDTHRTLMNTTKTKKERKLDIKREEYRRNVEASQKKKNRKEKKKGMW